MWTFFIKAFSFILGLSLLFNLLGTLADRVAPLEDWRVEHQQLVAHLQASNNRIEAITLGNSHSESIDYSVLGIEGQSLAFAAADLFEIEKYAVYLKDELPGLQTVFIAVSYYSFSRDNAELASLRSRRIRFYSMVPARSPIQGDFSNFLLGRLESYTHVMSVVRSDSWRGVWMGLFTDTPPPPLFPYDGVWTISRWGVCNHYTSEQLDEHAFEIAQRNVSSSQEMAAGHPGLEQAALEALARTIEQLQAKGIRVILYTPTYHEKYNQYFAEEGGVMIDRMRMAVGTLQQTHGVDYYDFSADPQITTVPELFYNSDHLSDCGRRVMTEKLLAAINQGGQLVR